MALLSISQAAREWETSRSRLYALKADGKLSFVEFPDGRPALDTSELVRVLGEPGSKQVTARQDTDGQGDQKGLREENRLLSLQLEVTQRERDAAMEDKDRLLGILESQTRLLQGPETAKDRARTSSSWVRAPLIVAVTLGAAAFLVIKGQPDLMTWSKSKVEASPEAKARVSQDRSGGLNDVARERQLKEKEIIAKGVRLEYLEAKERAAKHREQALKGAGQYGSETYTQEQLDLLVKASERRLQVLEEASKRADLEYLQANEAAQSSGNAGN